MRWSHEKRVELPAARPSVFDVLSDYESYPVWLPGVQAAKVLAKEGDVVVVEVLGATLSGGGSTVLEVVETAPSSILFSQVDQYRGRGLYGRCDLEAVGGGARTRLQVRATVVGSAFALGIRRRLGTGLDESMTALARQVARPASGRERRKILAVSRRADGGLELWLDGARYDLVERKEPD